MKVINIARDNKNDDVFFTDFAQGIKMENDKYSVAISMEEYFRDCEKNQETLTFNTYLVLQEVKEGDIVNVHTSYLTRNIVDMTIAKTQEYDDGLHKVLYINRLLDDDGMVYFEYILYRI